MSDDNGTAPSGQRGVRGQPNEAALDAMSREELVELGGNLDRVETVHRQPRSTVPNTKAERRAKRQVALSLGGVAGRVLLLVLLSCRWQFQPSGSAGEFLYTLATPLYGLTLRLSILAIGIGAAQLQKSSSPKTFGPRTATTAPPPSSTANPPPSTSPTRSKAQCCNAAS